MEMSSAVKVTTFMLSCWARDDMRGMSFMGNDIVEGTYQSDTTSFCRFMVELCRTRSRDVVCDVEGLTLCHVRRAAMRSQMSSAI